MREHAKFFTFSERFPKMRMIFICSGGFISSKTGLSTDTEFLQKEKKIFNRVLEIKFMSF